ncbi:MAG: hypothetical protein Q9187_007501, partial [Circinaria calcarea]
GVQAEERALGWGQRDIGEGISAAVEGQKGDEDVEDEEKAQNEYRIRLDSQLDQLFSGWNIYTTLLALILITYLIYPLFFLQEPDTHPLLLARQASAFPVRQPGESAIYRSLEVPHGYPLRTGLNVKDPDAPKWQSGRDGDLRDVWKQALRGSAEGDGKKARIISVMGQDTVEYPLGVITMYINMIGEYLRDSGAKKVVIFLPNSIELLVAFFAAAFYGFMPVLIPQGISQEQLIHHLKAINPDCLLAPAGTLAPQALLRSCPSIKRFIWVVEKTSRQMDWKASTEEVSAKVATWHDIIEEKRQSASSEPPLEPEGFEPPPVVTVWQGNKGLTHFEIVGYSQKTIVAAIAAQISVLPPTHRLGTSDLVLSLDSLSILYPMIVTLAALFSGASIAVTSVAGPAADLALAFQVVTPTIVIATADTLLKLHKQMSTASGNFLSRLQRYSHTRSLAAGVMPKAGKLTGHASPRLIYTSAKAGVDLVPLSSKELSDLRLFTGARIIYALTATGVAGAIAQTNVLDYRGIETPSKKSHFGPPLSCVEIKLVETPGYAISDREEPVGDIVVAGPAVVEGETEIGVIGSIGNDNTLALAA